MIEEKSKKLTNANNKGPEETMTGVKRKRKASSVSSN